MNDKKEKAKKIIAQDMRDYWKVFKMPARASSLRVRVARVIGGQEYNLMDILSEMDEEKKLKLLITESMTRFCVPYDFWEGMSKEEQFKYLGNLDPSTKKRFEQMEESEDTLPYSNFFSGEGSDE